MRAKDVKEFELGEYQLTSNLFDYHNHQDVNDNALCIVKLNRYDRTNI